MPLLERARSAATLIAYGAPGRREILVDGYHHAVSHLLLGEPIKVEALALLGLDDPALFVDLAVPD